MDQKEIEKIIDEVNGTMTIEEMPLTNEDKDRLRRCLSGKESFKKAIEDIKAEYKKKDLL